MDLVGIPTLNDKTMTELHQRILIWTQLMTTEHNGTDWQSLLRRYNGLHVNTTPLSHAGFKKKALAQAWTEATNDASKRIAQQDT